MDRCGDPHYAYRPIMLTLNRLAPFALWTAFPSSLVGRDSYDYYEASVAIGLAPRRRSRVRPCCTYRAERRWPTHLLECPHWASPAPRRLRRRIRDVDAGHGTGTGVFPVGGGLHHPEIGLQAIQLSPYSAGPAAPRTSTPGAVTAFLACDCPLHLSDPGVAIRPMDLPSSPSRLRRGYNRAPHGAPDLPPCARSGVGGTVGAGVPLRDGGRPTERRRVRPGSAGLTGLNGAGSRARSASRVWGADRSGIG